MIAKSPAFVLVFGSNREGQAGVGCSDDSDCIYSPMPIHSDDSQFFPSPPISVSVDPRTVSRVVTGTKQTFILTIDGSVLCCGENDNNELGRSGKRSVLQRMDAVEAFSIIDLAVGDGFCILLSKDGRMISWGQNSFGQLGCGDRDFKEKPKPNNFSAELRLLKVCAGSQHVLALARNGQVLTWGANRKGQLGNGQISSSCTPAIVSPLLHRPVIAIACGESHCLALTIGGNVFSWGDNSNGQLGTGDTSHRLRPELIRYLRAAKVKLISAGRQHSMAVSQTGLLFAFGSNSHGQCGLGDPADTDIRIQSIPVVVEKLQSLSAKVESVCCGSAHTLVLCSVPTKVKPCIYVMGLNSSGQLGLGKCSTVYRPAQVPFPEEVNPIGISTGPLSFHSFAFTEGVSLSQACLPSIDLASLRIGVERLRTANQRYGPSSNDTAMALKTFRQSIADAFSSVSVLNASFRVNAAAKDSSRSGGSNLGLSIDLEQVRRSYDLIFSIDSDQVLATLGRATLQLAEHLKECPFDDQENLSVFLIVLENPLMLRPLSFHVAIEQFLNGMLALPKAYQVILFGWYREYKSEYFSRALQVLQEYINFALTSKASGINPIHAVLIMQNLHHSNKLERIVPEHQFYNKTLSQAINLFSEWDSFKASGKCSQVFNYFSYPFLIGLNVKYAVLQRDFHEQKNMQVGRYLNQFLGTLGSKKVTATSLPALFPRGVKVVMSEDLFGLESADAMWWMRNVNLHLEIIVRREYLLFDLIVSLADAFSSNPGTFKLPLKVVFTGEEAVDHGGVAKELFTLAIKLLCKETGILQPTSDGRSVWFTKNSRMLWDFIRRGEQYVLDQPQQQQQQRSGGGTGGEKSFLDIMKSLSRFKIPRKDSDSPAAKVAKTNSVSPSLSHITEFLEDLFCIHSELLGLLVGLASYHGILIDLPLPSVVYLIMEGGHSAVVQSLGLSDLYAVDATLARSMKFILEFEEGSIEDAIGATFTASSNPLLQHIEDDAGDSGGGGAAEKLDSSYIDLKPGGGSIFVDRSNRSEFVQLFVQHALYGCCGALVDSYLQGLQSLFAGDVLGLCSHEEIELLICGTRDIGDLSELRIGTVYGGEFNDEHPIVQWFWDILSDMHNFEKRDFLRFVTGSDRVPVGGISKLGLQIRSTPQPSTTLPTSFTCFNILVLPSTYESKQQMKEKLYLSFRHCEGFGFS